MSKILTSRKILYGLLIILLVTNAVTIIVVSRFIQSHKTEDKVANDNQNEKSFHRTKYFNDAMDLSENQQEVFRELNREFNQNANQIYRKLGHKRLDLINALAGEPTDSASIDNLALDIGDLHYSLKTLTIEFYLGLKETCTDEQKSNCMRSLLRCWEMKENMETPRGRGQGRGYGRNRNTN